MIDILIIVCIGAALLATKRIIAWHKKMRLLKQIQEHFEETGELLEVDFFRQNIRFRK